MSRRSGSSQTLGRPREFDIDEATRKAMNVFWDRGYHDASLPDLLSGMDLTKGSFYKAFGDKKAIFLRALELYSDDAMRNVRDVLSSDTSPKVAIRNALLRYAELSSGPKGLRGCFAVLSTTEMLPGDSETAVRMNKHFSRLQDLFADAVLRGQAMGEIGKRTDAGTMALFIVSHAQGMRVLGKVGAGREQMLANVDLVMSILS